MRTSILTLATLAATCGVLDCSRASADGGPSRIKYQITGLFSRDRERDLREVFTTLPQFRLVSIDYANAEATVIFDPGKVWPGERPERYVELFNNALRRASHQTFGAKPLRAVPRERLALVEIPIEGLDCKGCSFAAYSAIYQLPGVEQATASFKTGKVAALIDPAKTNRAALEAALKKGSVAIKPQAGR